MRPYTMSSLNLNWRSDSDGFGLYRGRCSVPTLRVVRDAVYPGMWRVRWPDGRLSDMANLTRSKDAARRFAESEERRERGRRSRPALLSPQTLRESLISRPGAFGLEPRG
jgi:hypothetical protein